MVSKSNAYIGGQRVMISSITSSIITLAEVASIYTYIFQDYKYLHQDCNIQGYVYTTIYSPRLMNSNSTGFEQFLFDLEVCAIYPYIYSKNSNIHNYIYHNYKYIYMPRVFNEYSSTNTLILLDRVLLDLK